MLDSESSRVIFLEGNGLLQMYQNLNQFLIKIQSEIFDFRNLGEQRYFLALLAPTSVGEREIRSAFSQPDLVLKCHDPFDSKSLLGAVLKQVKCDQQEVFVIETNSLIDLFSKYMIARKSNSDLVLFDYQIIRGQKPIVFGFFNAKIEESVQIGRLAPELKRFFF